MKTKLLLLLITVIIVWLTAPFLGVFLLFDTDDLAGNTIIKEVYSPDSRYKAVIFERNAGATTGFTTQISVLPSDELLPNKSGNVFIADTNHGEAPTAEWGGPEVKLVWKGSEELEIWHHKDARIYKSKGSREGIKVVYKYLD